MTATPRIFYKQMLFDNALFGVRRQGGPSLRTIKVAGMNGSLDVCAYRGGDGKRCAVGWNIEDHEYQPTFEGKLIKSDSTFIPERLWPYRLFLREIQQAHDAGWNNFTYFQRTYGRDFAKRQYTQGFNVRMKEIAQRFGLAYTEGEVHQQSTSKVG